MVWIATIHQQAGGKVTLANTDGTVISVQPDGSVQSRAAGTAGVWELATLNGLTVTYQPVPDGPQFVFSLV